MNEGKEERRNEQVNGWEVVFEGGGSRPGSPTSRAEGTPCPGKPVGRRPE